MFLHHVLAFGYHKPWLSMEKNTHNPFVAFIYCIDVHFNVRMEDKSPACWCLSPSAALMRHIVLGTLKVAFYDCITCLCVYTYTDIYIYAYIYIHTHIYIHTCIYIYMYVHIFIYIYTIILYICYVRIYVQFRMEQLPDSDPALRTDLWRWRLHPLCFSDMASRESI